MSFGSLARLGLIAASALSCAAPLAFAPGAFADDFYKGKTVNLIVGSDAGGGFDTYSRALVRSMPKHIPGEPNIIIQYMPGATGITATNHLFSVAAKDGTVFGAISNSNLFEPLYGNKNAKYDPVEFNWIGSLGKQRPICVTWGAGDIKSLDDAKARVVTVSASSNTANHATTPRLLNHLLGTKFKVITGYSTSGARLAVERGEVDGVCGLSYQTLSAAQPDWFQQKKVHVIAQLGLEPADYLPGVPNALSAVPNEADRAALELLLTTQEMGRPYVAPPGVPADRLKILRDAFDATTKDPAFLADAEKLKLMIEPLTGTQMAALLKKAYGASPAVVDHAVDLAKTSQTAEK
jgi:tripartite-type tricarboxylate transporter receptor subunit TctC